MEGLRKRCRPLAGRDGLHDMNVLSPVGAEPVSTTMRDNRAGPASPKRGPGPFGPFKLHGVVAGSVPKPASLRGCLGVDKAVDTAHHITAPHPEPSVCGALERVRGTRSHAREGVDSDVEGHEGVHRLTAVATCTVAGGAVRGACSSGRFLVAARLCRRLARIASRCGNDRETFSVTPAMTFMRGDESVAWRWTSCIRRKRPVDAPLRMVRCDVSRCCPGVEGT